MNELELKRQIFDLYESARILFNDYYNGKEHYTDRDIWDIRDLVRRIELVNLYYINEEISNYRRDKEREEN